MIDLLLYLISQLWIVPLFWCCCGGGGIFGCDGCSANAPEQFQVEISGIGYSGTGSCNPSFDDCTTFDGTYILDHILTSPSVCRWQVEFDPKCDLSPVSPGIKFLTLSISSTGTGTRIDITFNNGSTSHITWRSTLGSVIDCEGLSGESVPININPTSHCNSDGSPAILTAL